MQLGLHLWNFSVDGSTAILPAMIADTARAAEEGGIAQLTVMDHWFQMESAAPASEPMLEAYSTLSFIAANTSRMRLGPLVVGVTYRHPGLLVKTATTLDVLSGGRSMLGIGAAWYEREHLGLGVPYPAISERFERLEETLQIALQMWSDDDGAFDGVHYHLAETLASPPPVQRPHPPIMIGGKGEKKTLRLAAQYAQIVNLTTSDPAQVEHLLGVLRGHCDRVGTDYDAIEKTVIGASDPFSPGFARQVEALSALGVTMVVVGAPARDQIGFTARLADAVVPALASL